MGSGNRGRRDSGTWRRLRLVFPSSPRRARTKQPTREEQRRVEPRADCSTWHEAGPARIYDLRSTFASNALAAGVTVFELAKIMGSSVRMIERHYGALLDGAGARISGRLDAFEAQLEQAKQAQSDDRV